MEGCGRYLYCRVHETSKRGALFKIRAWTDHVQGVWLWPAASLNYLFIIGVVLPWRVRTLPWLRGCVVSGCAPAGTTVALVVCVLANPAVLPVQRSIASGYIFARRVLAEPRVVCVRLKPNPLCCPAVRGSICEVSDCDPAGTMCARHVLSEPRAMCVRR